MDENSNAADSGKWITVHGEFTVEEDDLGPTNLYMESHFDSIDAWLTDMCKNDQPQNHIAKFTFGIYEYLDGYTLSLTGVNSYEKGTHTRIKIEFLPTHYFFRIPANYHEHMEREEVLKKIKADLDNFTKSNSFKSSFFTGAELVRFEVTGEIIWAK